jgi:ubiquinone/menaquinone biosynthesis C-methylase UbiE
MIESEFDKFADEYKQMHTANIRASGEAPEYFARYKIQDVSNLLGNHALSKLRILDFGAGVGTSVLYFREFFPNAEITCLDVSSKSLDIGRRLYPTQANFIIFDGRSIPYPDNTFDLVFAACVFHHISHDQHPQLLEELWRVTKHNGHCTFFEHNPYNPLTVRAVNSCPFDENAELIKAVDFHQRVERAGFSHVAHRFRIFFPRGLSLLRFIEPYLTWLPLGAQYYVAGQKK